MRKIFAACHDGEKWIKNLEELRNLELYIGNKSFYEKWHKAKQINKNNLAEVIKKTTGIIVNPGSIFDIQAKRIHEYKRQHLNVLHIITLYNRIRRNPNLDITPRTFIFAGKAAPSYFMAKLIIKLITSVGAVINNDPIVKDKLKVVFLPNYSVKNARWIYPCYFREK